MQTGRRSNSCVHRTTVIDKRMKFKTLNKNSKNDLVTLFQSVFSESEGEQEGALLAKLVEQLAENIDNEDIICFAAFNDDVMTGAIFFTRLTFATDIKVFMLAPVAVASAFQRQGIGQALIAFGLNDLKQRSVQVAITYGDPAYYSKLGFKALSEQTIKAPLTLSMPFGWLGQSLTGESIPAISECPACVEAFNDPVYW